MPFRVVVVDTEVRRRVLRPNLGLVLAAEKGLWTEETIWKIRMNEHIILEGYHVPIIVKSFPKGMPDVFDGERSGDASKNNRSLEPPNGGWINITESVGSGIRASAIDDAGETVRAVLGDILKELTR